MAKHDNEKAKSVRAGYQKLIINNQRYAWKKLCRGDQLNNIVKQEIIEKAAGKNNE